MSENENDVRVEKYELMTIFFTDLGESGIRKELEAIKEHLISDNGEIFHEDIWGMKDLAYTIKKQTEGFYVVLNFNYPTEKITELEKSLNINPAVIRYLIVKTPLNYAVKTLAQYQDEEEKMAKEEEAKKAEKEEKRTPIVAKKVMPPKKAEEPKAPKVEKVEKVEPPVEPPKKAKKTVETKESLEEFDQKLKSIIDDPDIKL